MGHPNPIAQKQLVRSHLLYFDSCLALFSLFSAMSSMHLANIPFPCCPLQYRCATHYSKLYANCAALSFSPFVTSVSNSLEQKAATGAETTCMGQTQTLVVCQSKMKHFQMVS